MYAYKFLQPVSSHDTIQILAMISRREKPNNYYRAPHSKRGPRRQQTKKSLSLKKLYETILK